MIEHLDFVKKEIVVKGVPIKIIYQQKEYDSEIFSFEIESITPELMGEISEHRMSMVPLKCLFSYDMEQMATIEGVEISCNGKDFQAVMHIGPARY